MLVKLKYSQYKNLRWKLQFITYSSSHLRDLNLEIVARTHALLLFHACFNMRWASKETGPEYTPEKKKNS